MFWRSRSPRIVYFALIMFFFMPMDMFAQGLKTDNLDRETSFESTKISRKIALRQILFLDFYNETRNTEYKYLEKEIGESVYKATINKYAYAQIDRNTWQDYVRRSGLTASHLADREKVQMMGQALPADGVVYGKFEVLEGKIHLSGRVLSVLSRELMGEVDVTIPISEHTSRDIHAFADRLAYQMKELFIPSDLGAMWRSALLPGWGQAYKRRETWGYIYGGAVGTGFVFSLFSLVMWQNAYSRYRNYNPDHVITPQGGTELIDPADAQAQFDRYASQAQTWQQITLVSIGVTLAVYVWQIMDAWIFDTRHAQLGKRLATGRSEGTFLILGGSARSAANDVQNHTSGHFSFGLGLSF